MLAVFSLQPSYFLLPFLWDYRYSSGQMLSWYVPTGIPSEFTATCWCLSLVYYSVFLGKESAKKLSTGVKRREEVFCPEGMFWFFK